MEDYNGSAHLIRKMEELLGSKKLSTQAAVRLLLEKEVYDIKQRHDILKEISLLKKTSIGLWASLNPKKALAVFLAIYSFSISEIREPVIHWISSNLKIILSLI